MLKKRECNAKALKIVEKLIDPIHDQEELFKMVNKNQWNNNKFIHAHLFSSFPTSIKAITKISSKKEPSQKCVDFHYATKDWKGE
jgi:hypothetical protein